MNRTLAEHLAGRKYDDPDVIRDSALRMLVWLPQENVARLLGITMQESFELLGGLADKVTAQRLDYFFRLQRQLSLSGRQSSEADARWFYSENEHLEGRIPASAFVGNWSPGSVAALAVLRAAEKWTKDAD